MTDLVQQGQSGCNAVTAKHLTFAYNFLHQRTNVARYQSTGTSNAVATTDATFDSANRLASLTHKQGATTLSGYTYGYDGASRLTSVTSTIEGLSAFSYDATSQVVGADHSSQTDETYSYDLNGNRNSSGYTTASNNQTTAGGGFTYVYDDEGNRISRTETATGKVQEYTWDYRNRLVTVKDRNSSGGSVVKQVDYIYDALNRLVKRSFDADGAGAGAATHQYWAYDEGINALVQFDGPAAANLSHRYLWSGNVDELLADEIVTSLSSGGNVQWPLGDHLGTLRYIADLNEGTGVTAVTNHRTYNAYGKLISETNLAVDLIFGFTGKQLDDATGMQHNLFRWYDSALGQWLSEDPLGFAAGDENLSRYVSNIAAYAGDPFGLDIRIIDGPDADSAPSDPAVTPTYLSVESEYFDLLTREMAIAREDWILATEPDELLELLRFVGVESGVAYGIHGSLEEAIEKQLWFLGYPNDFAEYYDWIPGIDPEVNPTYGPCDGWTQNAQSYLGLSAVTNQSIHVTHVQWEFPIEFLWTGHHAVRIEFYKEDDLIRFQGDLSKAELMFLLYVDNGVLGNQDHWFTEDEIPPYYHGEQQYHNGGIPPHGPLQQRLNYNGGR